MSDGAVFNFTFLLVKVSISLTDSNGRGSHVVEGLGSQFESLTVALPWNSVSPALRETDTFDQQQRNNATTLGLLLA